MKSLNVISLLFCLVGLAAYVIDRESTIRELKKQNEMFIKKLAQETAEENIHYGYPVSLFGPQIGDAIYLGKDRDKYCAFNLNKDWTNPTLYKP
jgi:cellobiose-specific phosphotransferase system component IIB